MNKFVEMTIEKVIEKAKVFLENSMVVRDLSHSRDIKLVDEKENLYSPYNDTWIVLCGNKKNTGEIKIFLPDKCEKPNWLLKRLYTQEESIAPIIFEPNDVFKIEGNPEDLKGFTVERRGFVLTVC